MYIGCASFCVVWCDLAGGPLIKEKGRHKANQRTAEMNQEAENGNEQIDPRLQNDDEQNTQERTPGIL